MEKIRQLYEHYQKGQIPTLAQHEIHPDLPLDSRERFLYFTLSVCLNFQRNSPALWQSAFKTWQDPSTNYLFFPKLVVKENLEKVQPDLRKHNLSLQINKHATI